MTFHPGDLKDVANIVARKLEVYINNERREERFQPLGCYRTTKKMQNYDLLQRVMEVSDLDDFPQPRSKRRKSPGRKSSRQISANGKAKKVATPKKKGKAKESYVVKSSRTSGQPERKPEVDTDRRGDVPKRKDPDSRPVKVEEVEAWMRVTIEKGDSRSDVKLPIAPKLKKTSRSVVAQKEAHRLSEYASLVFDEQPLDKLQIIHRYRPNSSDVPHLTENGKVHNYTRHVGSALNAKKYVDYYIKEGLQTGKKEHSRRLQQLKVMETSDKGSEKGFEHSMRSSDSTSAVKKPPHQGKPDKRRGMLPPIKTAIGSLSPRSTHSCESAFSSASRYTSSSFASVQSASCIIVSLGSPVRDPHPPVRSSCPDPHPPVRSSCPDPPPMVTATFSRVSRHSRAELQGSASLQTLDVVEKYTPRQDKLDRASSTTDLLPMFDNYTQTPRDADKVSVGSASNVIIHQETQTPSSSRHRARRLKGFGLGSLVHEIGDQNSVETSTDFISDKPRMLVRQSSINTDTDPDADNSARKSSLQYSECSLTELSSTSKASTSDVFRRDSAASMIYDDNTKICQTSFSLSSDESLPSSLQRRITGDMSDTAILETTEEYLPTSSLPNSTTHLYIEPPILNLTDSFFDSDAPNGRCDVSVSADQVRTDSGSSVDYTAYKREEGDEAKTEGDNSVLGDQGHKQDQVQRQMKMLDVTPRDECSGLEEQIVNARTKELLMEIIQSDGGSDRDGHGFVPESVDDACRGGVDTKYPEEDSRGKMMLSTSDDSKEEYRGHFVNEVSFNVSNISDSPSYRKTNDSYKYVSEERGYECNSFIETDPGSEVYNTAQVEAQQEHDDITEQELERRRGSIPPTESFDSSHCNAAGTPESASSQLTDSSVRGSGKEDLKDDIGIIQDVMNQLLERVNNEIVKLASPRELILKPMIAQESSSTSTRGIGNIHICTSKEVVSRGEDLAKNEDVQDIDDDDDVFLEPKSDSNSTSDCRGNGKGDTHAVPDVSGTAMSVEVNQDAVNLSDTVGDKVSGSDSFSSSLRGDGGSGICDLTTSSRGGEMESSNNVSIQEEKHSDRSSDCDLMHFDESLVEAWEEKEQSSALLDESSNSSRGSVPLLDKDADEPTQLCVYHLDSALLSSSGNAGESPPLQDVEKVFPLDTSGEYTTGKQIDNGTELTICLKSYDQPSPAMDSAVTNDALVEQERPLEAISIPRDISEDLQKLHSPHVLNTGSNVVPLVLPERTELNIRRQSAPNPETRSFYPLRQRPASARHVDRSHGQVGHEYTGIEYKTFEDNNMLEESSNTPEQVLPDSPLVTLDESRGQIDTREIDTETEIKECQDTTVEDGTPIAEDEYKDQSRMYNTAAVALVEDILTNVFAHEKAFEELKRLNRAANTQEVTDIQSEPTGNTHQAATVEICDESGTDDVVIFPASYRLSTVSTEQGDDTNTGCTTEESVAESPKRPSSVCSRGSVSENGNIDGMTHSSGSDDEECVAKSGMEDQMKALNDVVNTHENLDSMVKRSPDAREAMHEEAMISLNGTENDVENTDGNNKEEVEKPIQDVHLHGPGTRGSIVHRDAVLDETMLPILLSPKQANASSTEDQDVSCNEEPVMKVIHSADLTMVKPSSDDDDSGRELVIDDTKSQNVLATTKQSSTDEDRSSNLEELSESTQADDPATSKLVSWNNFFTIEDPFQAMSSSTASEDRTNDSLGTSSSDAITPGDIFPVLDYRGHGTDALASEHVDKSQTIAEQGQQIQSSSSEDSMYTRPESFFPVYLQLTGNDLPRNSSFESRGMQSLQTESEETPDASPRGNATVYNTGTSEPMKEENLPPSKQYIIGRPVDKDAHGNNLSLADEFYCSHLPSQELPAAEAPQASLHTEVEEPCNIPTETPECVLTGDDIDEGNAMGESGFVVSLDSVSQLTTTLPQDESKSEYRLILNGKDDLGVCNDPAKAALNDMIDHNISQLVNQSKVASDTPSDAADRVDKDTHGAVVQIKPADSNEIVTESRSRPKIVGPVCYLFDALGNISEADSQSQAREPQPYERSDVHVVTDCSSSLYPTVVLKKRVSFQEHNFLDIRSSNDIPKKNPPTSKAVDPPSLKKMTGSPVAFLTSDSPKKEAKPVVLNLTEQRVILVSERDDQRLSADHIQPSSSELQGTMHVNSEIEMTSYSQFVEVSEKTKMELETTQKDVSLVESGDIEMGTAGQVTDTVCPRGSQAAERGSDDQVMSALEQDVAGGCQPGAQVLDMAWSGAMHEVDTGRADGEFSDIRQAGNSQPGSDIQTEPVPRIILVSQNIPVPGAEVRINESASTGSRVILVSEKPRS